MSLPDRRYTVGSLDVFDAFRVMSSMWVMNDRNFDYLTLQYLGLDCDEIVNQNRTNTALLKSKKVRHFLSFWKNSGCLEMVDKPYTRQYFNALRRSKIPGFSFLNPRSIGSERYKKYRELRVQFYRKEPKKFPPTRYIGVGYSDRGCSRKDSFDGSPSWQEISVDTMFQEKQSQKSAERLKRVQGLVRDVSYNHSDPRKTRLKAKKRISQWFKEEILAKDDLFFG